MLDMLVAGVLLIMALYHLGLYVQRRRELGSLLFGGLCLTMLLRLTVTEEHYLVKYLPGFPAPLERILDVFSFFVLAPIFTWIFSYFFAQDFYQPVLRWVTRFFLGFAVVYLLLPLEVLFTLYLLFTLLVGLYLGFVLFLAVRNRRAGAGVFLFGFLLFTATTIWDILSYSNLIRAVYLAPLGFVAFIFAQAYALSIRFNQALYTSEKLTLNLEAEVLERTAALEESNRKLAALNITDALTGIHNRRHFDQELENEYSRALRNQRPLGLCILDIDHFKRYNDHYGHQGGDACLQAVAGVLAQCVNRAGETVARYGGEEFVVLLPENTPQEALAVAENILHTIRAAAIAHEKSEFGRVTVSLGVVSQIPTAHTSSQGLLKLADEALYRAKKQGRNQAVLAENIVP